MVQTQSLQFAYNNHSAFSFPDIRLEDGQNLLILGESGIGKTTLLHLLAGLLPAQSGFIKLAGTDITQLSTRQRDRFRGQHIGLVFQQPHFVSALTLVENLRLIQYVAHRSRDAERIGAILAKLGLSDKLHRRPIHLSQGEQQRAAIAMAVVNQPSLILADEPTASLDDKNCQQVVELLREQAVATGAHLVIITHDQRLKNQFERTLEL